MSKAATKKKRATKKRTRATAQGPLAIKPVLEATLRAAFPHDTVDISDGYGGNVHVLVVSRRFDGKNEYERQSMLHKIIDSALSKSQLKRISLLLAYSPSDIK